MFDRLLGGSNPSGAGLALASLSFEKFHFNAHLTANNYKVANIVADVKLPI